MNEKDAPYDLCFDVLRRFDKAGVLQDMILIGSWCVYFYRERFAKGAPWPGLRTRDVDFLIPTPPRIKTAVDIPALLKDIGFIVDFHGKGHMRLVHPELIIEFLVPEKGRGGKDPYPIKGLGVNAQPLRFIHLLLDNTISFKSHGITLRFPHPINYAFQKLIISRRRRNPEKKERDRRQAVQVLQMILEANRGQAKMILGSLPSKWRKAILDSLKEAGEEEIAGILIS